MRLVILANEALQQELLQKSLPASFTIQWVNSLRELVAEKADIYIDLLFEHQPERIAALKTLLPKPVIINAVISTLDEVAAPFIRINAWPGFLKRSVAEVAGAVTQVEPVMQALGWNYKIVPDEPGMVAPRVVAMIINEAYFALGEEVSTKAEIDTAMKLGTNYPWGPFEWAEMIGKGNIMQLLEKLSSKDERYLLAPSLRKEVMEARA